MLLDKILFEDLIRSKPLAQKTVFNLFYASLLRTALRYTQNEDDAKDIVSKALLKFYLKLDSFTGDEKNIFGWCKTIIIHEALDHIKSKTFRQNNITDPIDSYEASYSEQNYEREEAEYILKHIRNLPLTTATVFNLFAIEGYSHKEIGNILNISESNSKWHLFSAREKLQKVIFKQNEQ